ncbi:hypothetical protein [Paenibacillus pinihumi]|uniref:glycosyl-4,4'-diaponeurosporenoate acyltransferase CrtO family protein n=1 Tax=Paenibacillus pinihumi TaxID=669462 RepID=UPI000A6C6306|nr:hypothetical protein [Paenibacillus pinihumi]
MLELPPLWVITANISGWLIIHLGVSYACHRMPFRWFDSSGAHSARESGQPCPGSVTTGMRFASKLPEERFYEQVLRIRSWKDRVPELGALFTGGFSKKALAAHSSGYYRVFAAETRRGEWTHWLSIAPAPLFFLWNEPAGGWLMIGYALAANLPFICIQRYNRLRLTRIMNLADSRPGHLGERARHPLAKYDLQ